MTGGIIQLVSKGVEDLFITNEPQITFFKILYRRHTTFSMEEIQQSFIHEPDFGKRVTCTLSKSGDLITNMTLVITLPAIPQIFNEDGSIDELTRIAWIRKIGYGIIKEIEIEIGGKSIDKHYGEWLNIWAELNERKDKGIDKMIGNIENLYTYTKEKQEYKLFIPLQFWFSRNMNLALPILCLQYNAVKVNLELEDFNKCYKISPTHSILMDNDVCNFKQDEYIVQEITNYIGNSTSIDENGSYKAIGQFTYFNNLTKRLYYTRISKNLFKTCDLSNITDEDLQELEKEKYKIVGLTTEYFAYPHIIKSTDTPSNDDKYSISHLYNPLLNIKIKECFLLINYIFLDEEERIRYYKSSHEFLIDQLIYCGENTIDGIYRNITLSLYNPIKYIIWTTQQNYLLELYNNDLFNYTNSYQYNDILYDKMIYENTLVEDTGLYINTYNIKNSGVLNENYNNKQTGGSLIKKSHILLNSNERMEEQTDMYYNNVQLLQHFNYCTQKGINIYSFSLVPSDFQPSGVCNMSKIDNVQISVLLDNVVNINNPVKFKSYGMAINVLRIAAGLGGLIFVN